MGTYPNRKRPAGNERTALLSLLVLSAIPALKLSRLFAEDAIEHPFIEKESLKSETCLTCHPAKKVAEFVHTAVRAGCEKCHQPDSENAKTTIILVAEGGALCARCHTAKPDAVLHEPYRAGQCLVCHDPHTGVYPRQLRAQVNVLCLACHGNGQAGVKLNLDKELAQLPGGQTVSLEEYRQAPKVAVGHAERNAPRGPLDTVSRSRNLEAEQSCISCHNPHSSQREHLLRSTAAHREDGNWQSRLSGGRS